MKRQRTFILLLLLGGISVAAIAGAMGFLNKEKTDTYSDGKEEFKRLYQFLISSQNNYSIHGTIFLYDKENGGALTEKMMFSSYKSGSDSYLQTGPLQTYTQANLMLQVDTVQQFIVVQESFTPSAKISLQGIDLENLLQDTSTLHIRARYTDRSPDERIMYIQNDFMPEIKEMVLYYNPVNFQISQTEIKWWKEGFADSPSSPNDCWLSRTEMKYSVPSKRAIQAEIERFVMRTGEGYAARPEYSGYNFTFLPSPGGEIN